MRDGAGVMVLSAPAGPSGPTRDVRYTRRSDSSQQTFGEPFARRVVEVQILRGSATFHLGTPNIEVGAFQIERRAEDGTWVAGWPPGADVAIDPSPAWVGTRFPAGTYRLTYAASGSQVYETVIDLADGADLSIETPKPIVLGTVDGVLDGPARGVVKTLFFRSRQMAEGAEGRFYDFNLNLPVDAEGRFVAPILPGVSRVSLQDADAPKHAEVAMGPRTFAWPPAGPVRIGSSVAGRLNIRVRGRDGDPVPSAPIRVQLVVESAALSVAVAETSTQLCDEHGDRTVGPDMPGLWTVLAWEPGAILDDATAVRREVRVEAGRTTEIEIRLP